MKIALLLLAACAVEPAEPDVIAATKCSSWFCGTNSPVINGLEFHELNVDGLRNREGFAMDTIVVGPSKYMMTVQRGQFVAEWAGGAAAPPELRGHDVLGLEIPIHDQNLTHGMRIVAADEAPYWAVPPHSTGKTLVTYIIEWDPTFGEGKWKPLCATPSPDENLGMDEYHALVFEGERIDADTKTIASTLDPRWFNIGCAGSTLAKLQLTGHTQVAQETAGFSTTIPQRQTVVKMFSADYCGKGTPFTVAGQPLEWADDGLTMKITSTGEVEAQWTPDGASCLNTPRVVAHPTKTSAATFGKTKDQLHAEISALCPVPPPCTLSPESTGVHLWSWNDD